ncbi:MAG TPA: dTDP-4-dehydrorhamnose 3,5-epimerase [Chitinophagaceae bacterium]|nr:dTDP-4-dehydrorhamnose 3,5-epimerase [Chitinophagaceae bacterium]
MKFEKTKLDGSYIVDIVAAIDERGWFARTFDKNEFIQIGFTGEWVQQNHSLTNKKGTIRGMHYQLPPFAEIKLVRCIAGAVFDVIIDLRKNSDTFLHWFGTKLSAENKKMLYIPEGFAHGFQTLTDNSELIYHHSQFYKPGFEAGIKYNDPMVNIEWPGEVTNISGRDEGHAVLGKNFKGIKI